MQKLMLFLLTLVGINLSGIENVKVYPILKLPEDKKVAYVKRINSEDIAITFEDNYQTYSVNICNIKNKKPCKIVDLQIDHHITRPINSETIIVRLKNYEAGIYNITTNEYQIIKTNGKKIDPYGIKRINSENIVLTFKDDTAGIYNITSKELKMLNIQDTYRIEEIINQEMVIINYGGKNCKIFDINGNEFYDFKNAIHVIKINSQTLGVEFYGGNFETFNLKSKKSQTIKTNGKRAWSITTLNPQTIFIKFQDDTTATYNIFLKKLRMIEMNGKKIPNYGAGLITTINHKNTAFIFDNDTTAIYNIETNKFQEIKKAISHDDVYKRIKRINSETIAIIFKDQTAGIYNTKTKEISMLKIPKNSKASQIKCINPQTFAIIFKEGFEQSTAIIYELHRFTPEIQQQNAFNLEKLHDLTIHCKNK